MRSIPRQRTPPQKLPADAITRLTRVPTGKTTMQAKQEDRATDGPSPHPQLSSTLTTFIFQTLRPRYCLLTSSDHIAPDLEARSNSTANEHGVRWPTHPPPDSWLCVVEMQPDNLLQEGRASRRSRLSKSHAGKGRACTVCLRRKRHGFCIKGH